MRDVRATWILTALAVSGGCTSEYQPFSQLGAASGTGTSGPGGGATSATSGSGGSGTASSTTSGVGGGGGAASASSAASAGGGLPAIVIDVSCQGAPCAPGEVCCFAGVGNPASACGAQGSCPGAEIACDGPDDCSADTICCATYSQATQTLSGIHCAPTCAGAGDEFWMCTGDDTACLPMKSCLDDMVLGGGYKFCSQ